MKNVLKLKMHSISFHWELPTFSVININVKLKYSKNACISKNL